MGRPWNSKFWFGVVVLALALCIVGFSGLTGLAASPDIDVTVTPYSGFCDDFGDTVLDSGWTWLNPWGGSYSLTERPGALTISAPYGDFYLGWGRAPRVVQSVTGDFVITTRITKVQGSCWAGGLLAWQSTDRFMGVQTGGCGGNGAVSVVYDIGGDVQHVNMGDVAPTYLYARLERSGDDVTGSYSLDSVAWHDIATFSFPDAPSLDVGLYVATWQSDGEAYFDFFDFNDCPLEIAMQSCPPLTAPGARLPVAWEVKHGLAASETYVRWDTASHDAQNDYAHHTPAQSGGMGAYSDVIAVPNDAPAIYFKPYAVIDGEPLYAECEYSAPTCRAINVGGDVWGEDESGQHWEADVAGDYSATWYEFVGGQRQASDWPIANTADDWIYQTQLRGVSQANFWLGAENSEMTFQVTFHLAEYEATAAGQRVFDIYLERGTANEVAIRDVDVYEAAGGRNRALTYTATVHAKIIPDVDEHLTLDFVPRAGSAPILNGLAICGLDAVPVYQVTQLPGAGSDDTYCDAQGTHLADAEVLIGGDAQYHGGLRFQALHIPQGAVIRSAELSVVASRDAAGQAAVRIHAHADDSSPAFNTQSVVQDRARTERYALWRFMSVSWREGITYTAPDLSEVIQEIVDRPGWQDGNALSLLLITQAGGTTDSPRRLWSYEGAYASRAHLRVRYSRLEDVPTPTPTATATPTRTATPTATSTPAGRVYVPLLLKD